MHMMARRFALLGDMCKPDHPMMLYFIEHEGLMHEKTKIQASWWPLLNGCIPLKIQNSIDGQQLVMPWQDLLSFFEWAPSSD